MHLFWKPKEDRETSGWMAMKWCIYVWYMWSDRSTGTYNNYVKIAVFSLLVSFDVSEISEESHDLNLPHRHCELGLWCHYTWVTLWPVFLQEFLSKYSFKDFKNSAYCIVCMSETELNPKEKVHRVYRKSKYSPLRVTSLKKYKRLFSYQSWWSDKPFLLWISTMLTMCSCVGCLNIETQRW